MIVGVFLTLLSSASIFLSSVDLFLCLANSLKVSSRTLAACGRESEKSEEEKRRGRRWMKKGDQGVGKKE